MSHLYNQIIKHRDSPSPTRFIRSQQHGSSENPQDNERFLQIEQKRSSDEFHQRDADVAVIRAMSMDGESTGTIVSELTLEHALKPQSKASTVQSQQRDQQQQDHYGAASTQYPLQNRYSGHNKQPEKKSDESNRSGSELWSSAHSTGSAFHSILSDQNQTTLDPNTHNLFNYNGSQTTSTEPSLHEFLERQQNSSQSFKAVSDAIIGAIPMPSVDENDSTSTNSINNKDGKNSVLVFSTTPSDELVDTQSEDTDQIFMDDDDDEELIHESEEEIDHQDESVEDDGFNLNAAPTFGNSEEEFSVNANLEDSLVLSFADSQSTDTFPVVQASTSEKQTAPPSIPEGEEEKSQVSPVPSSDATESKLAGKWQLKITHGIETTNLINILSSDHTEPSIYKDEPSSSLPETTTDEFEGGEEIVSPTATHDTVATELPTEELDDSSASSLLLRQSKKKISLVSLQYSDHSSGRTRARQLEMANEEQDVEAAVDDSENSANKQSRQRNGCNWRYIAIAVLVICVIVAVVVVAVLLTRGRGGGNSAEIRAGIQQSQVPSPAPSIASSVATISNATPISSSSVPTTVLPSLQPSAVPISSPQNPGAQRENAQQLLQSIAFDGGEALRMPGTPQNQAFEWLVQDSLNLTSGRRLQAGTFLIQRYSMATLYFATDGENWINNTNWLSREDVCTWSNAIGNPCSSAGDMIGLGLGNNNLVGTLPPEVAHLSFLAQLDFKENQLDGTIPIQFYTVLLDLVLFNLSNNTISGSIPTEIGQTNKLQDFRIEGNSIQSSVPTQAGLLGSLTNFHAASNNLTGTIPSQLGALTSLSSLLLTNNQLSGTVPDEVCAISIQTFEVDCSVGCSCCTDYDCEFVNNRVEAVITQYAGEGQLFLVDGSPQRQALLWLSAETNLDAYSDFDLLQRYGAATHFYSTGGAGWLDNTLWLSSNDVCSWFGVSCQSGNVTELRLAENNLNGTIALEVSLLSSLSSIDFQINNLGGPLQGEILSSLDLTSIELGQNKLTGVIPTAIGSQRMLTILNLDANQLEESIPSEIGLLSSLESLCLESNLLNGTIPTEVTTLENLRRAKFLDNDLFGLVPPEICLLGLEDLEVDCNLICSCCSNECTGSDTRSPTVSPTFSPVSPAPSSSDIETNIIELLSAKLPDGGVRLQTPGSPPNLALEWLIGDQNVLSLPTDRICQRFALVTLYYSTSGETWNNQGRWLSAEDECTWYASESGGPVCNEDGMITILDLDNNNLVGSIPPEIALLSSSLEFIDFFNNDLIGQIPTEIGMLTMLRETFDVDSNRLSGLIPTEFGLLKNLTAVWLNDNMFTGNVPPEFGSMSSLSELYLHQNDLTGSVPDVICDLRLDKLQVDCGEVECSCCSPDCPVSNNQTVDTSPPAPPFPPTMQPSTMPSVEASLPPSISPSISPSDVPSFMPLSSQTLGALLASISFDGGAALSVPGSPQARAAEWLESDTNLANYSRERIIQRYALVTLFYSTNGPSWNNTNFWLSQSNECIWYNNIFLPCNPEGRLTALRLDEQLLEGTIPPEIALLSDTLTILDLEANPGLVGTIPDELYTLTNLKTFDLSETSLMGTVSTEVGKLRALEVFRLFRGMFNSTIPTEFGLLNRLEILDFGLNDFTGAIPTEIGSLKFLIGLSFFGNEFTGTIPTEFAGLTSLQKFYIDDTSFEGTLPAAICAISSIQDFWSDCQEIQCGCCTTCCEDGGNCITF